MALSYGSKGTGPVSAKYACGGDVVTTRSRFFKSPNSVRTGIQKNDFEKSGKGGTLSKMSGETKLEKTIKPRT